MPLTDKAIKNAPIKEAKYKLTDGEGMYLYVWPNGSKYWRLKYRIQGKEKTLALGTYPTVSLAKARDKRFEARQLISQGIDPSAQKVETKRKIEQAPSNTFKAIARDYFETFEQKWSQTHHDKMWRRLEMHVFPYFGNKQIKDIGRAEVIEVARRVEKRAPYLAKRILQLCKVIFSHAVLLEKLDNNPALEFSRILVSHKHKNYPALKPAELPAFLKDLAKAKTSDLNRLMIKLLMLTFVRQQELRFAHWADINLDTATWYVRAETMKMREEHIVPLSTQAVSILRQIQQYNGNYKEVFPSHRHSKAGVISDGTINMIIKRMGYAGRLVGHGFRTIASTILNEQGFRGDVIERQLAHGEKNDVRAAYNRAQYLSERKVMMQWWGDHLEKLGLTVGTL